MRMDRYDEEKKEVSNNLEMPLSRTNRNQEMYKDAYLNTSYVDIKNIFSEENSSKETEEELENHPTIAYEEKNYNINDYLEKAHERLTPDDDVRSLDSKDFTERESEISKLIAKIDEKSTDDDFFSSLISNNEDTLISGQVDHREIATTFEELYIETISDNNNTKLSKALTDETINNLKLEEDELNNTFQDIFKNEGLSPRKKRNIALVIFFITLFILIVVILIIIFK